MLILTKTLSLLGGRRRARRLLLRLWSGKETTMILVPRLSVLDSVSRRPMSSAVLSVRRLTSVSVLLKSAVRSASLRSGTWKKCPTLPPPELVSQTILIIFLYSCKKIVI
jgi:hypothetical protein